MKTKLGDFLISVFAGACILAVFAAIGLMTVLKLRSLYVYNIGLFGLEEVSGLSKSEILLNYDWLVSWCMPWNVEEFALPSFPVSEDGLYHFEQVKEMITLVFGAGAAAAVALSGLFATRRRDFSRIAAGGGIAALTAAVFSGILIYSAPHEAFVRFHEIAFRNDKWIFDEATDPVINILPESYFMQCAAIIVLIVFAGSLAMILPHAFKILKGRRT